MNWPCTVLPNTFPHLRKQASKKLPSQTPSGSFSFLFLSSLSLSPSHNVKCNWMYAMAALMMLRLYRLMMIFFKCQFIIWNKEPFLKATKVQDAILSKRTPSFTMPTKFGFGMTFNKSQLSCVVSYIWHPW